MRICFDGTALEDTPLEDQIRAASAAGFKCLVLQARAVEAYLGLYPTAVLDALLRRHRAHIAAISGRGSFVFEPGEGFLMIRARFLEICTHLDALGGGILTVCPGRDSTVGEAAIDAQRVRALQILSDLAAPFEVRIAIEPLSDERSATWSPAFCRQFVERVSRPNVGLALRVRGPGLGPSTSSDVSSLDASRLWLVYLDGISAQPAAPSHADQPADSEALALREICRQLAARGYRGPYSIGPSPDYSALDTAAREAMSAATELLAPLHHQGNPAG